MIHACSSAVTLSMISEKFVSRPSQERTVVPVIHSITVIDEVPRPDSKILRPWSVNLLIGLPGPLGDAAEKPWKVGDTRPGPAWCGGPGRLCVRPFPQLTQGDRSPASTGLGGRSRSAPRGSRGGPHLPTRRHGTAGIGRTRDRARRRRPSAPPDHGPRCRGNIPPPPRSRSGRRSAPPSRSRRSSTGEADEIGCRPWSTDQHGIEVRGNDDSASSLQVVASVISVHTYVPRKSTPVWAGGRRSSTFEPGQIASGRSCRTPRAHGGMGLATRCIKDGRLAPPHDGLAPAPGQHRMLRLTDQPPAGPRAALCPRSVQTPGGNPIDRAPVPMVHPPPGDGWIIQSQTAESSCIKDEAARASAPIFSRDITG